MTKRSTKPGGMIRRRGLGLVALAGAALGSAAPAQQANHELALDAPGPQGPLRGTMIELSKDAPVVLIIPGSGPTNRDGDSRFGLAGGMLRQVAAGLAAHGIASVRIDKRGMFGSAAAVPDANSVTIADHASDVRSWIGVIRKRTGAPCVWVLGHSEGGLVALTASQSAPDICGLLLVATAGRPLAPIMRAQLRANPANAPLLDQAMAAIDSLEAGRTFETTGLHPALMQIFNPRVQPFLIDTFRYDPAKLAAAYKGPMLILQGRRDMQVTQEDAAILKNAHPSARLVILPNVNHVLKPVASADPGPNFATYGNPSLPIDPAVIDALVAMVRPDEQH